MRTVNDLDIATAWSNKPVKGAASEVYEFFVLSTCPGVLPVLGRDEDPVLGLILLRQSYPVRCMRGTFHFYCRRASKNDARISAGER